MSSDDEFKDTYGDIAEETSEPLEIESTDTTKATMPDENESKPNKSISRSLTTHLGLLKSKVDELRTYMDDRETARLKCIWSKSVNKIKVFVFKKSF